MTGNARHFDPEFELAADLPDVDISDPAAARAALQNLRSLDRPFELTGPLHRR
jgi:hypothetical protein